MPLKFDLKKLELRKFDPGLNREQLIALAAAAAILVVCVIVVSWSLGVRSEALAELGEKQDALALLESRVGGGAKGRGPVRNPAAPPSAFLTTQTQGLAGAELQAYLAGLAAAQSAEVVSSGVQPTSRDDPPETIRLQATLTTTIGSLQTLLYQLETGTPYVFIDSIAVQLPNVGVGGTRQDPVLRVTLGIRALWRKGTV
jgi:general secretion pathway protein M